MICLEYRFGFLVGPELDAGGKLDKPKIVDQLLKTLWFGFPG